MTILRLLTPNGKPLPIHTIRSVIVLENTLYMVMKFNNEHEALEGAKLIMYDHKPIKYGDIPISPQKKQEERMDMPAPCSLAQEELK